MPHSGGIGHFARRLHSCHRSRAWPYLDSLVFTAEGELPACGHGTVAALVLLAIREGGSDHHAVLCTTSRNFEGWAIRNRDSVTASFDPGPDEPARRPGIRSKGGHSRPRPG